jgi:hypothetical protein
VGVAFGKDLRCVASSRISTGMYVGHAVAYATNRKKKKVEVRFPMR